MAKWDDAKTHNQIKAYPRGSAQGGRAIQAVKGGMSDNDGTSGHRTIIRETSEGRAIARTRDEMPMVEVEKQACEIGVDHGIIDMHAVGPLHPDAYKDGDLYFTPFVAAHIGAAAPDDPDRPIVDEIEPPESVKGEAPTDGDVAKSLTAGGDADKRASVYAKKVMMGQCPASIFTGRTRLWVQALYGRQDALDIVSLYVSGLSATPSLKIAEDDAFDVLITTSTGVYLDPVTAKHWMISVVYDKVTFYPMETSEDCIDELRTFLLDPAFPAEDKERVETYILADSKPSISKRQEVTIPATSSYSMGYGWHFNWSGDRCDIVLNSVVPHGGGGNHNVSTHFRLSFSKDEHDRWAVLREIVEGPVFWKNEKHQHVIAEPEWSEGVMMKFGSVLGPLAYGNAPFYVFYKRDELNVCRYSAVQGTMDKGATRSPDYLNPGNKITFGSDSMHYERWESWSGMTVTLSCGGNSVSNTAGTRSSTVETRSSPAISSATFYTPETYTHNDWEAGNGPPTSIPMAVVGDYYEGNIEVYSGTGGFGTTYSTITLPPGWWGGSVEVFASVSGESFTRSYQHYISTLAVVPYYDAEAVYMLSSRTDYSSDSGTKSEGEAAGYYYQVRNHTTGQVVVTQSLGASGAGAGAGSISRTNTPTTSTTKFMVCNAGVFNDYTLPAPSAWFAPENTVAQQLDTRSSASGESVRCDATAIDSGNPATTDANIYVGWA